MQDTCVDDVAELSAVGHTGHYAGHLGACLHVALVDAVGNEYLAACFAYQTGCGSCLDEGYGNKRVSMHQTVVLAVEQSRALYHLGHQTGAVSIAAGNGACVVAVQYLGAFHQTGYDAGGVIGGSRNGCIVAHILYGAVADSHCGGYTGGAVELTAGVDDEVLYMTLGAENAYQSHRLFGA